MDDAHRYRDLVGDGINGGEDGGGPVGEEGRTEDGVFAGIPEYFIRGGQRGAPVVEGAADDPLVPADAEGVPAGEEHGHRGRYLHLGIRQHNVRYRDLCPIEDQRDVLKVVEPLDGEL